MRTEPRPSCYVCGDSGGRLYDGLQDNLFSAPGTWSLKKCRNEDCGLLWLDPAPVAEDLALAYQEYYTHGLPLQTKRVEFAKRIYRLAVDGVLSLAGIPAERQRAYLMFIGSERPSSLLDVGCGHGSFLAAMAQRGWKVAGVDFDPAAAEAAQRLYGLDVRVGTVETMVASGMTFDVVTASHVIEHVPDPVDFLVQCRRLLKPGGRVILKTPNAISFGHRRYGRAWRGLEPPRHLHIFTSQALMACAGRAGFSNGHCFTTSVGAEGILVASHMLKRKNSFRPAELSGMDLLECKVLGPLFAILGKIKWLLNKNSGEELCAVLKADVRTVSG